MSKKKNKNKTNKKTPKQFASNKPFSDLREFTHADCTLLINFVYDWNRLLKLNNEQKKGGGAGRRKRERHYTAHLCGTLRRRVRSTPA